MMNGRVLIDAIDAYDHYGVAVADGSWTSLASMPPLKEVESNDWQEEDGIEADLAAPVLDSREVTLTLAAVGMASRYQSLVERLADGGYHRFAFPAMGREFTLRLLSHSSFDYFKRLGKATVKLADDFPLQGYEYHEPQSGLATVDDYTLDGRPLTDYGARVLRGAMAEVLRPSAVKQAMKRGISTVPGAIYDGAAAVTFKSKEVKLPLLMRSETAAELWRNYDALLYDLARPGERLLAVAELGQEFPCHYKSCQVTELLIRGGGQGWLKFTLTLVFTRGLRIDDGPVLAAEGWELVTTEDDTGTAIDLEPETDVLLAAEDGTMVETEDGSETYINLRSNRIITINT